MDNIHQNGGFKSSTGFILACIGSAVGMGTILDVSLSLRRIWWRCFFNPLYFIFYLIWTCLVYPLEFAIGRRAKTGTLGAYEYCWSKN